MWRRCVARAASRRRFGSGAAVAGSENLDWSRLGFDFQPSNGFVKYTWRDGSWDHGAFEAGGFLKKIHVMSSCLQYGQGVYEGAKAHCGQDGQVRLWNIKTNAARMLQGAERMMLPEVPPEMFIKGCEWAVAANYGFVPPYKSKGAMYMRPYLFGHGAQVDCEPAPEYHFVVLAIPVSSYYAGGLTPIDVKLVEDSDRAAKHGVGDVKASGNYGADILVSINARAEGYQTVLYLDPTEKQYIEEFSVSNFIGIKHAKKGCRAKYVTPATNSVLRSTTNDMLMQLAEAHFDMDVEQRPIHVDELEDFDEVAGCGTAVVMMGVNSITRRDGTVHKYANHNVTEALYAHYRAIQFAEVDDVFGWGTVVDPL